MDLPNEMLENKIANIIKEKSGKLSVKEYSTASAYTGQFSGFSKDLEIKKSFKLDIIFIDYFFFFQAEDGIRDEQCGDDREHTY